MPLGESDTRAKLIDPGLHARGWTEDLIPSITIQRNAAAALTEDLATAERCVRAARDQLDAINVLPAALLHRAFSGEL